VPATKFGRCGQAPSLCFLDLVAGTFF
jgi:hypothetical protein